MLYNEDHLKPTTVFLSDCILAVEGHTGNISPLYAKEIREAAGAAIANRLHTLSTVFSPRTKIMERHACVLAGLARSLEAALTQKGVQV